MLSKCANPTCTAKLHYLHEGKIFRIDLEPMMHAPGRSEGSREKLSGSNLTGPRNGAFDIVADAGGAFKPEYFWLCSQCSLEMTLGVERGTVIVLPVNQRKVRHAAAS